MNALTAMLNSTTAIPLTIDGIRPTPIERLHGRIMRAPDHDAGTGSEGGDDGASDAGAGDTPTDAAGDQAGDGDGQGDDGEGGDATIIGTAKAKTGTGKDGEGSDKDGEGDDAAKTDGPPEAYEIKLTVGEGDAAQEVEIDAALLNEATPILKDLGLNNEQANKVAGLVPKVQERLMEQQVAEHEAMSKEWAKAVKSDKELGGKNWPATEHNIGKALDRFGNTELESVLEQSRLGNHPGFVRMMASIGAALGEDKGFPRGGNPTGKVDTSAVLYPDDVPKT
jgi:hypothetical protein